MMESKEKILSIKSLKIGYTSGNRHSAILPPLTASALRGELIAVIGRNGVGKSTFLRTLSGLQQSLGGDVFYSGEEIKKISGMDLALKTGFISTEPIKVNNMSVYDLVALGRFPHTNWTGKITSLDNRIILDAMKKTSVSKFSGRFIAELSDGERQKSMIARLLAQDTPIMLMDEPTAFLDTGSKFEIMHLMHQLVHNEGKTIIFTTHDFNMAVNHSDKIWLILDDGLKEGAPEDLMILGAFEHLFESSPVQFNSENGTYTFREEKKGSLYVEGEGRLLHWTEEAVRRAGYSVSAIKTIPYIKVNTDGDKKWQIISENAMAEFSSIYEMIPSLVMAK